MNDYYWIYRCFFFNWCREEDLNLHEHKLTDT